MTGAPSALGPWAFALGLYERPGVADRCLHLQDTHGADVLLVLHGFWRAVDGIAIDEAGAAAAVARVRPWREAAIRPLRAVRRSLKPGVAGIESERAAAFRERVKALELEAERIGLEALAEDSPGRPDDAATDARALAVANVSALLHADGVAVDAAVADALAGLARAAVT
ncbi:MAG: TIGR02444 family protein [Azospirillaceae bacterium]